MARRQKTSPAEDLIKLTAKAPWWVGAFLAVISYVGLQYVAAKPVSPVIEPGRVVPQLAPMLWQTFAQFGQYIFPLIFTLGALLSIWKRKQRTKLLEQTAGNAQGGMLDGMSWQEFELLVGEIFRQHGYTVIEQGGSQPDGGVDLVLKQGNEKHLVQCKQWRAQKVGVAIVRELYGVMAARGATGGYMVTSGQFTTDAKAFAEGRNIDLIDGEKLKELIAAVKRPTQQDQAVQVTSPQPTSTIPTCPQCANTMVRRVAKSGANAGNAFWGCSQYPACRGTLPV